VKQWDRWVYRRVMVEEWKGKLIKKGGNSGHLDIIEGSYFGRWAFLTSSLKFSLFFFFFFMKKIFNRNITQIVCSFPHQPQLFFSHLPTSLIYLINVVWTVPNTHGVGIAMVNTQQRRYVICWTWLVPVVQSKSIIKKLIFFVKIIIY
jgi:hypothetical protein